MTLIDISQRSGNAASTASKGPKSIALYYVLICVGFSVALLLALIWQNQNDAYASVYCIVLFAICLGPILMGRHNFRHRLLVMFMG
jgi:hypothetical protein